VHVSRPVGPPYGIKEGKERALAYRRATRARNGARKSGGYRAASRPRRAAARKAAPRARRAASGRRAPTQTLRIVLAHEAAQPSEPLTRQAGAGEVTKPQKAKF
jgi:hypothetical protein